MEAVDPLTPPPSIPWFGADKRLLAALCELGMEAKTERLDQHPSGKDRPWRELVAS